MPAPTPAPTPAPAAGFAGGVSSSTGPVPSGFARNTGKVVDAATGVGIAAVCVYAGPPAGCPAPNLNTDAAGNWAFDFPAGIGFTFNFEHPLYTAVINRAATNLATVQMTKK